MPYFTPLTPAEKAAKAAEFQKKLTAAGAFIAANPSPVSFPTNAAQLAWYRAKLTCSAPWALRTLELIYQRQTAAEQSAETTTDDNGIGFSGTDAEILSSFAQRVRTWNSTPEVARKYNAPLSAKQLQIVFKKIPKYAGQLLDILKASGKAIPVIHVKASKVKKEQAS